MKIPTQLSPLSHKLLRLLLVIENYLPNINVISPLRINFFPKGFFSASHADSSFVGASDIGQQFT